MGPRVLINGIWYKTFDDYVGGCPECGGNHGYLSVGCEHWFVCHDHKTKWCVGTNLFQFLA